MLRSPNDAFICTSPLNLRYFTHLEMNRGAILIYQNHTYYLDWSKRPLPPLPDEITGIAIQPDNLGRELLHIIGSNSKLIVEDVIPLNLYRQLTALFPEQQITTAVGLVETLREIKTDWEIQQIKKACEITDVAFDYILGFIKPGMTERMVGAQLEMQMKLCGMEASNKTIVAAGVHSSSPHHWPTDYVLQKGDFITMDYGCTYHGYHSDLTRTIFLGKADDTKRAIYNTVLDAQRTACEGLRKGKTGGEIDRIARSIIEQAGYKDCFIHNLGHGIGLDIHEGTGLVQGSDKVLASGMVVSIEPGIYIEGYGGVRIEDIAVVHDDGCEILEHSPKELIEL